MSPHGSADRIRLKNWPWRFKRTASQRYRCPMICRRCQNDKPITAFQVCGGRRHDTTCKECRLLARKQRQCRQWEAWENSRAILVEQRPVEQSTRPNNTCRWEAVAVIGGKRYAAQSRRGAPHELARILVAANISDAPMQVRSAGLEGHITYRSFHRMAETTFVENAQAPIRKRSYVAIGESWDQRAVKT